MWWDWKQLGSKSESKNITVRTSCYFTRIYAFCNVFRDPVWPQNRTWLLVSELIMLHRQELCRDTKYKNKAATDWVCWDRGWGGGWLIMACVTAAPSQRPTVNVGVWAGRESRRTLLQLRNAAVIQLVRVQADKAAPGSSQTDLTDPPLADICVPG